MSEHIKVLGNQNANASHLVFKIYRDYHYRYWCIEVGIHDRGQTLRIGSKWLDPMSLRNCNSKAEAIQVALNFLLSTKIEITEPLENENE